MIALRPYGPTHARPHDNKRNRPTGVAAIDIHAHIHIDAAQKIADAHPDTAPIPFAVFTNPLTTEVNARQNADRLEHISSLDRRIAEMDAMGIDQQVIIPAPPQSFHWKEAAVAAEANRATNDAIAEVVKQVPKRLHAFGTAPMQNTDLALAEMDHCVENLGFKGMQVLTNINGEDLASERFEPFWAKAQELDTLIFLHPNGISEGERLKEHYFINVVGNPFDTSLAVQHLIFGGVLERYPNLRILLAHGGGYLASYSGRIDHAWGARRDCQANLPNPPTHYLKKLYFDTIVFSLHQLRYLVDVFGADHLAIGTDYPYDMGEYDPIGHVLGVEEMNDAQVADLLSGTARKLLKI
ncbi:MAG: amidohydrolase family protein [Hyphomicrobiaceae bacterium]